MCRATAAILPSVLPPVPVFDLAAAVPVDVSVASPHFAHWCATGAVQLRLANASLERLLALPDSPHLRLSATDTHTLGAYLARRQRGSGGCEAAPLKTLHLHNLGSPLNDLAVDLASASLATLTHLAITDTEAQPSPLRPPPASHPLEVLLLHPPPPASAPMLTSLTLSRVQLLDDSVQYIASLLCAPGSRLTVLDLSFNHITDAGAGILAESLATNLTLAELSLRGNAIDHQESAYARTLASAVVSNGTLHSLDLSFNRIGPTAVGILAAAPFRRLRLARCMGDPATQVLFEKAQTNPDLAVLDLARTPLSPRTLLALAAALAAEPAPTPAPLASLCDLSLRSCSLGVPGMRALAPILGDLPALTTLDLGDNNCGSEGAKALAVGLGTLRRPIQSLKLCQNVIGASGLAAVVQVLLLSHSPAHSSLHASSSFHSSSAPVVFEASCNPLKAAGAQALAAVLAAGPIPEPRLALNLNCCSLGDEGAAALCPCLPALRSLCLSNNSIADSGALALAAALPSALALTTLVLRRNIFGDEAKAALRQARAANTGLRFLDT